VIPDDPAFVGDFIEAHKDGQRFRVRISKYVRSRSRGRPEEKGNQLGFFFGVVVKTWMKEIDFTIHKEESYYNILNLFSYEMVPGPKGKPRKKLIHVDDAMTTEQMSELIGKCQVYAAEEMGVFIDDPDPRKSKRWRAKFLAEGYGTPK
jgi:hypothetical protein